MQHTKWFAFQWQIPFEPQLRHLDLKFEFQTEGGITSGSFMWLFHRVIVYLLLMAASMYDLCTCKQWSLLFLRFFSDTIKFISHGDCRVSAAHQQVNASAQSPVSIVALWLPIINTWVSLDNVQVGWPISNVFPSIFWNNPSFCG